MPYTKSHMLNFTRVVGVVALSLGIAALEVGCNDDAGDQGAKNDAVDAGAGGGGGFSTGVTPSKPLNQLTPQETQKVCEDTAEHVSKSLQDAAFADLACRIAGLVAVLSVPEAQVQMACATAYSACKASPAATEVSPESCGSPQATECTATVAAYEACVNELPADIKKIESSVASCAKATKTSVLGLVAIPGLLGPACRALNEACPNEFNGLTNFGDSLPGGFGAP
jgi:hypothetical protein